MKTKQPLINLRIIGSFKITQTIGSGGFGEVYEAIYNNSSTFALKSYKYDITNMKEVINELKLLRKVDYHKNIIHFYGVTKNEGNEKYLLVLEYADSGTLRSYLQEKSKSINWDLKLKFAYEIASAVLCLHENNIIHRDLHSNNILVHQKTIKLADFGLSPLDISNGIREKPIPNTPDEYVNLYKACWQDNPKSRPDIQYVEKMLIGMISDSNIVDKVNNEENDVQSKNEDSSSFSHPSTILTEPTSSYLWQEEFNNNVKEFSENTEP
nr:2710_t:CDS:2 [Entrophospora candida]